MTSEQFLISFDTETHLIGPENVFPKVVCLSMYDQEDTSALVSSHTPQELADHVEVLLSPEYTKIGANVAFDLGVLVRQYPHILTTVFEQIEAGLIRDVQIREKLLNLAEFGRLQAAEMSNGAKKRLQYSLAALVKDYLGVDISVDKDAPDAWRTNYSLLESIPLEEWPEDARRYAVDDARYTLQVFVEQEIRRQRILTDRGIDPLPLEVEKFRVGVDFALKMMTSRGVAVDAAAKAEIEKGLIEELKPENLDLLIQNGILSPAVPASPYANGAKDADGNPKMKAEVKEKVSTKALGEYILALAKTDPRIELRYNDPTETEIIKAAAEGRPPVGNLCVNAEWMEDFSQFDPMLAQYHHRQKLQKMVTTELPRMELALPDGTRVTAPVVHANFDVLKETGRTSSFSGDLYPSFNCQNVDPRARGCYVPRPGYLMFSVDYNQMELGTAAQTCINLFGHSDLADKINKGMDLHGYLGAQLARSLDSGFSEKCPSSDPDEVFNFFMQMAATDPKFFKHYRTFAKPTGLGYPGGLGAETFVAYAKATYGVIVDLETAQTLKEVWLDTFSEFREYFDYINKHCKDPHHDGYCYSTPLGMYRANASYCATANGMALQSPSAEGALLAVYEVTRACYDPERKSILFGKCFPTMFIHDEIVGEVLDDEHVTQRVMEVGRIMVESMKQITPDVDVRFGPALMQRWNKSAEAAYDEAGNLICWKEKS